MKKVFFKSSVLFASLLLTIGVLTSCDDSDNGVIDGGEVTKTGPYFVSVSGESSEYIMQLDDIASGSVSIKNNIAQLEQSGYTWLFSPDHKKSIGLIYRQGDPGIGLGFEAVLNNSFNKLGEFQVSSRFTTYGFFGNRALTAVSGQTPVNDKGDALLDKNGEPRKDGVTFNIVDLNNGLAKSEQTITTLDVFKEGEIGTFSGIVDRGDGTFLTGVIVSLPRDPNASGGSSDGVVTEPNKVWVAALDGDMNVKHIFEDNRISYSSGRFRSQYYTQIGVVDDGTAYIFSGSYDENTTLPAGVLRINKSAQEFDQDYYFNIQEAADNYKFRKVWHMNNNYFLLEFYNSYEVGPKSPATTYAIVDVKKKQLKWVEGLPASDQIVQSGLPSTYGDQAFFPVVAEGKEAAIYIIDAATATAKRGVEIKGVGKINAVGYLEY